MAGLGSISPLRPDLFSPVYGQPFPLDGSRMNSGWIEFPPFAGVGGAAMGSVVIGNVISRITTSLKVNEPCLSVFVTVHGAANSLASMLYNAKRLQNIKTLGNDLGMNYFLKS